MNPTEEDRATQHAIVEKARELGASKAGIAIVADLKGAPSYSVYHGIPYYEDVNPEWPDGCRSILVLGLAHPASQPSLDWWNEKVPGHTPGNRLLLAQSEELRSWMSAELGIGAHPLPYRVERGGIFLKDAAALAGLGVIGKHNLLITPEFGTRVRLQAMFLEADLQPTGPIAGFDPCRGCDMPCHRTCPVGAFADGSYDRKCCVEEMDRAEAAPEIVGGSILGIDGDFETVKYCRNCELACPVAAGRGRQLGSSWAERRVEGS